MALGLGDVVVLALGVAVAGAGVVFFGRAERRVVTGAAVSFETGALAETAGTALAEATAAGAGATSMAGGGSGFGSGFGSAWADAPDDS